MEEIILLGGGGHCRAVIDVIEQEGKFSIVGVIDKKELLGKSVLGYKVIGCDDDLQVLSQKYKYAFITVGQIRSNALRVKLFNSVKALGYILPIIVSPFAYLSKHAEVAEGSVIMHHALVNANAKVAQNCIINTKALIEHDALIEEHSHISTGVIINGGTVVKANSFVGSGALTKEYIELNGFIKAGSVTK